MKKYSNRGFTLIELLVVIAIIGILSSVVLASLSTARTKAADAKVKSQLNSVRTALGLYSPSGAYLTQTSCTGMFADSASGLLALTGTSSNWPSNANLICKSTTSAWAVSATLSNSPSRWCVDSTGYVGPYTAQAEGLCADN